MKERKKMAIKEIYQFFGVYREEKRKLNMDNNLKF